MPGVVSAPKCTQNMCIFPENRANWVRRSAWSPDGSALLSQCEDKSLRVHIYNPPNTSLEVSGAPSASTSSPTFSHLQQSLNLPMPAPVLATAWYPYASPHSPAGFCFAASVRETPVRLVDAGDGRTRASYPLIDHRERHVAPHSMGFSPMGDKLYAGTMSSYTIFDVSRPGNEGTLVPTTPQKKSKEGLKGIISSLVLTPSSPVLALGSLTPAPWNVALYDTDTDGVIGFVGLGSTDGGAGISQLIFNPVAPHLLYGSFRGRQGVYLWDLRGGGDGEPVARYTSGNNTGGTSQRHFIDVDPTGRWLAQGDSRGDVRIWDLAGAGSEGLYSATTVSFHEALTVSPQFTFRAHTDAVPSVAFNPASGALLTTSGARHFFNEKEREGEFDGSENDIEADGVEATVARRAPVALDSSLSVWELNSLT